MQPSNQLVSTSKSKLIWYKGKFSDYTIQFIFNDPKFVFIFFKVNPVKPPKKRKVFPVLTNEQLNIDVNHVIV